MESIEPEENDSEEKNDLKKEEPANSASSLTSMTTPFNPPNVKKDTPVKPSKVDYEILESGKFIPKTSTPQNSENDAVEKKPKKRKDKAAH